MVFILACTPLPSPMDFLLIAFLTLLNGVFAMSEMAISSSRKARLGAMAEAGDTGAQAALVLMAQPTRFLSTVQVGITSIGMLNGIVGEAAFSEALGLWLRTWGMTDKGAGFTATAIVVTTITFVTIIFGELVPKRIAQLHPEATARWLAPPMRGLATIAAPFVKLLSGTTAGVLHLLRIDTQAARPVTEEEISASLEEGVDAGLIEEHEHQMVQNVFRLDDRNLASLMVPRTDVTWLDASNSVAKTIDHIGRKGEKEAHSWYPVCKGSLDEVIGVISIARLLELGA
jgi:putative hemolysin